MRKILTLSLLILLLAISCTRTVYVPVQRPARVYVGPHIQSVAVVDRTFFQNRPVNIIESVLTGEMPGLDKEAAQRAIDGLIQNLQNSDRYQVVRTGERFTNPTLPGVWTTPFSWDEVQRICTQYNTHALLVLETFDSNFIVTNGTRVVKRKDKDGNETNVNEVYAEGIATVRVGFRLYDPAKKTIIDEYMYSHNGRWEAAGTVLQAVLGSLIDHKQAVNEVSTQSGRMYAGRISPQWIRLNREFYTKGKGDADFSMGVRRATVNDWNGATQAWLRSVHSPKRKTAGRSAFNLALMYEINGDLETALDWAQRSYTDYGVKQGRTYSNALRRRIRDAALLNQ